MELPRLMVAPNGATRKKADHPAIPVTIPETVATAKACFEAGADGLHAHVRDANENHILDAGAYRELIAEMALQVPSMQVQITTEAAGRYTPEEQRQLVKDVRPAAVSISMKELFRDQESDKNSEFYQWALEEKIAVQHILYTPEELEKLAKRVNEGQIPETRLQLLFVLGRYSEGQQSHPDDLTGFLTALAQSSVNADWAICAFGKMETACLKAAHEAGGKMRVGFENSLQNADGSTAQNNQERVREVCNSV